MAHFSRLSCRFSGVQVADSFTGEVGIFLFDLYLFLYSFVERLVRLFYLRVCFRNQWFCLLDLDFSGIILALVGLLLYSLFDSYPLNFILLVFFCSRKLVESLLGFLLLFFEFIFLFEPFFFLLLQFLEHVVGALFLCFGCHLSSILNFHFSLKYLCWWLIGLFSKFITTNPLFFGLCLSLLDHIMGYLSTNLGMLHRFLFVFKLSLYFLLEFIQRFMVMTMVSIELLYFI